MTTVTGTSHIPFVSGELSYLDPASTVLRRFTAPGNSVNTGIYRSHVMPVYNGRAAGDRFTLDHNGFEILDHRSSVTDFTDRDEVDRVYAGEVADVVRSYTGADAVATLGWMLRRSEAAAQHASQPQAALVHDDFSVAGARERARSAYTAHFPDRPGFHRALITSLWRVFSPPPQDWPLAVCDYPTVGPDEGLDNRMYLVDEIPEDLYRDMPADAPGASGFEFHHNPAHRWWYFPDMTRDEILLFKLNDSDESRAWRVPHTAFRDPTARATRPRHSIEFRTIAYFE
jgi:hypothetical protein